MPITVYTYHDPYKLKENTNLWKEISSCPYFCVSQTLVNGLKSVYGSSFQIGRVTTVMNLTSALLVNGCLRHLQLNNMQLLIT